MELIVCIFILALLGDAFFRISWWIFKAIIGFVFLLIIALMIALLF